MCGDTSFWARSTSSHLIRQHCVSEQYVSDLFKPSPPPLLVIFHTSFEYVRLALPITHISGMLTLTCGVQDAVCCPSKPSSITVADLPSLVLVMHLRVSHHTSDMITLTCGVQDAVCCPPKPSKKRSLPRACSVPACLQRTSRISQLR